MMKEERDRWKRVMLWEESEEVQRSQFHFILGLIGFTVLVATVLGIWDHDWGALATVGYVILLLLLGVAVWSAMVWGVAHAILLSCRLLRRLLHPDQATSTCSDGSEKGRDRNGM